jgi:hypothetical protein
VLKVLEQLPEGLAIAVLTASPASLDHHLYILPADLHPLAIEAAFPSMRQERTLALDLFSPSNEISSTTYAVMQAATAAACALQKLHLRHIPVQNNDQLLQMIAAVCKSASDVNLSFECLYSQYGRQWHSFAQVVEALSTNSDLSSLHLTFFCDDPCDVLDLDCLLRALTGSLKSLSLEFSRSCTRDGKSSLLPVPRLILNFPSLTYLSLGPGFQATNLQHVIPVMTQLQALHLRDVSELRQLPSLATLTALNTLVLWECSQLLELPPLDTLTALQTLKLYRCSRVWEMKPLVTLTGLQALELSDMDQVR